MPWHRFRIYALIILTVLSLSSLCEAGARHSLSIRGNRITLDGKRGQILYRDCGDLNGDRHTETAFAMRPYDESFTVIVVARRVPHGWQLIATHEVGYYSLRTDVTDANGDGRAEIVARGMSGDGHGWCDIYTLRQGDLVEIGNFSDTRLRDLTGDGIPEVLSISMVSAGFIGDHWLTIYKWNGQGYTDVSRRFPHMYDPVIRDLRQVMHALQFTKDYGFKSSPHQAPELFADLYYYLGKAYEYRGLPAKARTQYAIAYRLDPKDDDAATAFRRTNVNHKP